MPFITFGDHLHSLACGAFLRLKSHQCTIFSTPWHLLPSLYLFLTMTLLPLSYKDLYSYIRTIPVTQDNLLIAKSLIISESLFCHVRQHIHRYQRLRHGHLWRPIIQLTIQRLFKIYCNYCRIWTHFYPIISYIHCFFLLYFFFFLLCIGLMNFLQASSNYLSYSFPIFIWKL